MKQLIQDLQSGQTRLEEVPAPQVRRGSVLIKTHRSLVSLGTERMLVEFGKANWFEKARQQPDKVKQVIDKIKTDGLQPTLEAVFRKLGEPLPLGYCNAGEVVAVGEGVTEFSIGDRVISNGHHAELVCVPKNLVAKIPEGVSFEEASFTVVGAIALQGIRLAQPTFGETVVVTGLGLIGLVAGQLLRANGCRVVGLDFDENKVELAKTLGIEAFNVSSGNSPVKLVEELTGGIGADAVVITASSKSNEIIHEAAQMSRKRGRIVLVGVIGLDIRRANFFEKELTFQVSCSYGPGRYDPDYEQKGIDYPLPFVRWTEKRNFEAVLRAIAEGSLKVAPLISEVIDFQDFEKIYGDIGSSRSIASILKYSGAADAAQTSIQVLEKNFTAKKGVIGIIGSGNFTQAMILPCLKKAGAEVKTISSARGLSGTLAAKKFGIARSTTSNADILGDAEIDTVVVTTQHNTHARLAAEALLSGKNVFVEKPLALTINELEEVEAAWKKSGRSLTVGFNRRFAPLSEETKKLLGASSNQPMHLVATMNAGEIPASHWTQDLATGGGRIVGEACHLMDLMVFLTGSEIEKVVMTALGTHPTAATDSASILLKFKNGSTGVVNYFSNGSKGYAKERVEVFSQNRTAVIDNWRRAEFFGFAKSSASGRQDKGHQRQFDLFMKSVKTGGPATIPFEEILNVSRAALAAVESLKTGAWVDIG